MRAVLIVLALIALSFAGLLGYGVARDRSAEATPGRDGCGGMPPIRQDGSIDPDDLDGWCPPDLSAALGGIGRRFAPGIAVRPREVALGAGGREERDVPAAAEELPRAARVTLVDGGVVAVTAASAGDDDRTVCLCRPGAAIGPAEAGRCRAAWIARLGRPPRCPADGDVASIPFGRAGGRLRFEGAAPARLRVG